MVSVIRVILAGLLWVAAGVSWGQHYPVKPVRILVGYTPGGGVDTTARMMAAALSELWGSTVLVENRPGAAGNIATEATAKAPPDGYTLVLCNIGSHAITPARFAARLNYDPVADFAFPVMIGGVPNVFMVHPSLPIRTLQQYIQYAKRHPGKLNFGSSGVGASPHLSIELWKTMSGINIVHVPYKGNTPSITDAIAGNVELVFSGVPALIPHIKSGRLRPIAISSIERFPAVPEIPTFNESGVQGYEASNWFGLMAPSKVSKDIVNKVNADVNKALASKDLREKFDRDGLITKGGTIEMFDQFIRAETGKFARVIKRAGIKQL